jgi:uncharacterized protein (TIGR02246 family)
MTSYSADEAAIRQHIQEHADTLNQGDPKAYATHFAPDADTMGVGGVSKGRENIEQTVQGLLAGPFQGAKWKIQIDSLRFLTPTMALLDCTGYATTMAGPPTKLSGVSVMVKEDGQWFTTALRTWVPATAPV